MEETVSTLLKDSKGTPTIGRYEILGTLGRGNMGEVFRARDPMIGRMVALKTRRFDLVYEKQDLKFVVNKFFEEARIAGNLIHPNIVTVYDVGQDGDYCYIAMELLEGENLAAYNKEGSLLPPRIVTDVVMKVCVALDFAHGKNVIHRDVKPANLMFTRDNTVKITDFGIAMSARGDKTGDLQVMGTPSYMSPEQTKGLKLTNQTDFFSLGVVLFELLCGRRPFHGRTLYELMDNIRYSPPPSILKYNPGLPQGIDLVIQRALEKEPDLRYPSGTEFAAEIGRAMEGQKIPVRDMRAAKKADLLKSVEFFRAFNRDEIEEIAKLGTFIRYQRSQVVLREGDVDSTFFVLLSGRVRVVKNRRKIADLIIGACFGEMGAFTRTPRTAHVIAREPCIVLKLDLKKLQRENQELRFKFYEVFVKTLIERLEITTRQLSGGEAPIMPKRVHTPRSSGEGTRTITSTQELTDQMSNVVTAEPAKGETLGTDDSDTIPLTEEEKFVFDRTYTNLLKGGKKKAGKDSSRTTGQGTRELPKSKEGPEAQQAAQKQQESTSKTGTESGTDTGTEELKKTQPITQPINKTVEKAKQPTAAAASAPTHSDQMTKAEGRKEAQPPTPKSEKDAGKEKAPVSEGSTASAKPDAESKHPASDKTSARPPAPEQGTGAAKPSKTDEQGSSVSSAGQEADAERGAPDGASTAEPEESGS